MQYTKLGNSDLNVSRICMGCMGFGDPQRGQHSWTIDEEHSREIIKRGLKLGVNFYDTAIAYQSGTSEQYVGSALRDFAKRDEMVVATKFLPRTQDEIEAGVTGQQHIEKMLNKDAYQNTIFFPIGEPNPYGQFFIGQSYLAPVSTEQVPLFNVTFEPGCRNNWHIHHASEGGGQMLICVGGRGYYQEWGKEPRELHPGDVVNIPANVKHWHGAAPDAWFSHLAIEVKGEDASTEWCEPVSGEEYGKLR